LSGATGDDSEPGDLNDGQGGTPYSVLHMALDYRAEILDRLDTILAGTGMSVDEVEVGEKVAEGQGGYGRFDRPYLHPIFGRHT